MDGFTVPDVSLPAPAETVSAPSEAAPSASATSEASTADFETALQSSSEPEATDTAAVAPEAELPDETAFEQLTGPERGQNWKQARTRISELNQQVQQFAPYQPLIEQIEQAGGLEAYQQQAELGALLFSLQDSEGRIHLTAEPLIERLASESPNTLGEIVWKGIHQPNPSNPEETIGHAFLRDYLGLDPNLLDTYRAIQSPEDARNFLAPGQITAEELANIPAEFHEAYKSLTPRQREELAMTGEDARNEFLQDKADALQARQFLAEQKAEQVRQRELAQQQFQQRVEMRGQELGNAARESAVSAARERLAAEVKFSPHEEVNDAIRGECIQWAIQQVLSDPTSKQDNDRAEALYGQAAYAELIGDRIQAQQLKLQADGLAKKLEGRFLNTLTKRTALWSKGFGDARQAHQQQVAQARPRAELATNAASSARIPASPNVGTSNGFGFSPQQLEQYEAMIRARQMGQ